MPAAQSRNTLPSTSSTTAPFAARDDERIVARVGRRDEPRVALDDRLGLRAGSGGLDIGSVHDVDSIDVGVIFVSSACRPRCLRAGCRAPARSLRMRSASAKSRRGRAAVRVLDQLLDLLDRHRRLLVFRAPQRQHAEHPIELVERRRGRRATSPAPSSPASIAEFSARTRSNITPSAAAVFRSSACASRERRRAPRRRRPRRPACARPLPAPCRAARGSRSAAAALPRPAPSRSR